MKYWYSESEDNFVDAIEEGKIVRVTENYAKLEGLPILRKNSTKIQTQNQGIPSKKLNKYKEGEPIISLEDLRKPLNYKKNHVISELKDNFHWEISKRRRQLGLTRKHLADSIKESESAIKLVENGILPRDDFVIINKIQERLQINLRKDKQDFTQSPRSLLNEKLKEQGESEETKLSGNEIEIDEE